MLIKGTDSAFLLKIADDKGPVDVTGAQVSILIQRGKTDIVEIPCTIIDGPSGNVMADITKETLIRSGTYEFQTKIIRANGKTSISNMNSFFVGESLNE